MFNTEKFVSENVNAIWEKIQCKLDVVADRVGEKIPYSSENGVFDDKMKDSNSLRDYAWWTNGFWPGLMWLMHVSTNKEKYKNIALTAEEKLKDCMFRCYDLLHHDVGFMYHISAGVNAMLNDSVSSKNLELMAANTLASRYNLLAGFIRAWNGKETGPDVSGWAIIDCMMNIPLLYRATELTSDNRFKSIAMAHADKTLKYQLRDDGSVKHIVVYDTNTGEYIEERGGQGYKEGSSWSRGQAWAIYGFVLSYIHTKEQRYLDAAKRVANYFISAVCDEWKVLSDFRAPESPIIYDSTAAACAACGLIEISKCVPLEESRLYLSSALKLIDILDREFADYNEDTDAILQFGTEAYHSGRNKTIIYGDYFYVEAIYKLKDFGPLFW